MVHSLHTSVSILIPTFMEDDNLLTFEKLRPKNRCSVSTPMLNDKMRVRVAVVSTFPPSKEGIAEYTAKLTGALSEMEKNNIMVLANVSRFDNTPYKTVQKSWSRNSLKSLLTIPRAIIGAQPNVVHIQHEYLLYGDPYHSGLFLIILVLLGVIRKRVIITMHSVIPRFSLHSDFFDRYGIGRRFSTTKKLGTITVTKLMGLFSKRVIVHNEVAKTELIRGYKFPKLRICVIPHGVDLTDSNPTDSINRKNSNPTISNTIVYFGFVRPGKGIEYAIKALPQVLRRFSKTRLIIAGGYHPYLTPEGTKYIAKLKELVKELNLKGEVVFSERFIPNDELVSRFSTADIFIMPYTESDIIGASGVLSKIACYGKPIVATNVPRFRDITDGKHGLIVPSHNSQAIAEAIIKLLSNDTLRLLVGHELQNYARDNCWKNVARTTLDLYKEVLGR